MCSDLQGDLQRGTGIGYFVTICYDSIEVSAPIEHAAEVIEIGFYELDDHPLKRFPWLELPVGCDAEIGFDWGDVRHVHRGITQEEILEELAKLR